MDAFIKQLQQIMTAHGIRVLAMTALDPRTNQPRSVKTPGADQVLRVPVAAQFGFSATGGASNTAEIVELRAKVAKLEAELEASRKLDEAQGETSWEG